MKLRSLLLFFLIFFLFGSEANAQYLTGPNGVHYFFWKSGGPAQRAEIGDLVFMDVVGKTETDSIILSSYMQGQPFQIFVPTPTYRGCFYEMFTLLGEGDSAEVSVVADSLYLKSFGRKLPDYIREGSKIKITLKLSSIVTKKEYDDRILEEGKHASENQTSDIERYISEKKLQMTKSSSGMYYQFALKGSARRVKKGDIVLVHYTGYFLDGKIFDSSLSREQPFEFEVGNGGVIKGWDEALQLMSIRDKLMVIIPYQLGYGEKGNTGIPPFTPLIFEIELLNIN